MAQHMRMNVSWRLKAVPMAKTFHWNTKENAVGKLLCLFQCFVQSDYFSKWCNLAKLNCLLWTSNFCRDYTVGKYCESIHWTMNWLQAPNKPEVLDGYGPIKKWIMKKWKFHSFNGYFSCLRSMSKKVISKEICYSLLSSSNWKWL